MADVVLEAPEAADLPLPDLHRVAHEARPAGALDGAVGNHAPGDGAHLADLEDLTDFGFAEGFLDQGGGEEAGHGLSHVVDGVVDDVVEANLDAFALREPRRLAGRSHAEPDDDGLGGDGEVDVAL